MCSEPCPSVAYCQKCGSKKREVVDMIDFLPYSEVNLDDNPVIVLDCGHFFTVEFLDGMLQFDIYYDRLEDGSFALKPFPAEPDFSRTNCPSCRSKLQGISRYNRILKMEQLVISAQKYHLFVNHHLSITIQQFSNAVYALNNGKNPKMTLQTFFTNVVSSTLQKKLNVISMAKDSAFAACSKHGLDNSLIAFPGTFSTTLFELKKASCSAELFYLEAICFWYGKICANQTSDFNNIIYYRDVAAKIVSISLIPLPVCVSSPRSELLQSIQERFSYVFNTLWPELETMASLFQLKQSIKDYFHEVFKKIVKLLVDLASSCSTHHLTNFFNEFSTWSRSKEAMFTEELDGYLKDLENFLNNEVDKKELESVFKALDGEFWTSSFLRTLLLLSKWSSLYHWRVWWCNAAI
ncbi:hypothetical protein GEMRC1_008187 [Eukaryota sp. GEM-RC1]